MQASERIRLLPGVVVLMALTLTGGGACSSPTGRGTIIRSQEVP